MDTERHCRVKKFACMILPGIKSRKEAPLGTKRKEKFPSSLPLLLTPTRAPDCQDPIHSQQTKQKCSLQSPSTRTSELRRVDLEMRDVSIIISAAVNVASGQHSV